MKPSVACILLVLGFFGSLQVGWADLVSYTYTTIDVPGATSNTALGINNAGQIVGDFGGNIGGGFLATPIPEPTSLRLFATGLAGIIIAIVRRRMTSTPNH